MEAATRAATKGTTFGAPTEAEVELATRIVDAVPSVEQVRLVNSGTEAAMSAIRLARGATGRDLVVKFAGCYHGHSDSLLAHGAGSGLATFGIPSSPGVTEGSARDTLTVPFNDLDAVRTVVAERGGEIAVIAVEPIAANMGVVPPEPGFLEGLRALCDDSGAMLLFDEVITGFRVGYGGAQDHFGVRPDLTAFGKVMGGGFPCAAFGGPAALMQQLAATGPVYQAGTLSGNPVAVAAGIAALDLARTTDPYSQLDASADVLTDGLATAFADAGIAATINRAGVAVQRVLHRSPRAQLRGRCRSPITSATRGSSTTCWIGRVSAALGLRAVDPLHGARPGRDRSHPGRGAGVPGSNRTLRMMDRAFTVTITALLAVTAGACQPSPTDPRPSDTEPDGAVSVPCPDVGPAMRIGQVGTTKRGVDPAVAGISGLGVSVTERDGAARIAWAVGDRSANEIAGPDAVVLFALDARNGSVVERFGVDPSTLEPGPDGDPVTNAD